MSGETVSVLAAAVSALVGMFAIIAVVYKLVVLPRLREDLLRPVRETHRQVTQNRHVNREPTVLDRLEDLNARFDELGTRLDAMDKRGERNFRLATAAGGRADQLSKDLEEHKSWAREEDTRVWAALLEHTRKDKRT